jgi:protein involved in sex pheromone biosynthesis
MSHHQQERENTMKKHLIIVFAICVLFLSACGSLVGTSMPSSNPASHSTAPIATASTQSVCQVLHDRQAQLSQAYQAASAQLVAAQAGGNLLQVGEAEKTLMRLHQSIPQVQAQLKAC